jgi:riboflavin synthase
VFTGLVEEIGRVQRLEHRGDLQRLQVHAPGVAAGLRIGDSVNVAGACQTAVAVDAAAFTVESVAETLRRTTLGRLQIGDEVNLERACRLDTRLGGHLVLGHVDAVGRITTLEQRPDSWTVTVEAPAPLGRYIAAKGSVALDGISLTVVHVTDSRFSVAVIPHTFHHTTLARRRQSDQVNVEVDIIARYLERLLSAGPPQELTWDGLRALGY